LRLFIRLLALLLAIGATEVSAADAPRIGVRTGEHPGYSRIVFDWTSRVGVTVETPEPGALIVLFDRPARFDLAKAPVGKLSRVAAIEPLAGRSAVRIRLRGAHGHKLMNVDFKIVVDILDDGAGTASAADGHNKKTIKSDKQEQADHSRSAPAAALPVDAAVPGRSAPAENDGDPLLVQSSPTTAEAGRPELNPAARDAPDPRRDLFLKVRAPIEPVPDPLFDPGAWRGGSSYPAARAAMAERLAAAPHDPATLLALAQFQFAWRHPDEALSVLDTLRLRHPAFASRVEVLALKDAAQILAGRPRRQAGVFERTGVRDRPEARLWQGAAAALANRWEAAGPAFEAGRTALNGYPANFRAFFGLLAMQAALDAQALDTARWYAGIVAESAPDPDEAAMLEALTGVLLLREQDRDAAWPRLQAAARARALRPQIVARLALIELDRSTGRLDTAAALDALEQLYFSWEGDALQLDILERMTALLIELRRYDQAFAAVALAEERFPSDARAQKLASEARALFQALMTGETAEPIDAIEAAALYEAHPDLRPTASESAAISRGLARRLVELDLIGPALRLYDEALRAAPVGARAEIGAEMAAVRLEAGDAAGALAVLDATGEAPPASTQAARSRTRAQALAGLGDNAAALSAIGAGQEPDQARARADLHWRNREWGLAADEYLRAFDGSPTQARLVLRAVAALLLSGRSDEVVAVKARYGPAVAGSPLAPVFERLTAPDAGVELLALPEVSAEIVRAE
jgi:hypothetical protein